MLYCSRCGQSLPPGRRICANCYSNPVPAKPRREASSCLLLGNFYLENHHPGLANLFYRAAIIASPNNWQACFNLGCQAWQQGKIDKALTWWEASLKINSENYLAHYNLGTYYLYNRNLSAARYHLARVRRIKPDYLAARVNLGTVYLLLGMTAAAWKEYKLVLEQEPGHKGARRGLVLLKKYRQSAFNREGY